MQDEEVSVAQGSAPAAMPSLHVSIACIASYYAIRAHLKLCFLILPMAAWIPLEAVVARWHYLADVPAGMLYQWAGGLARRGVHAGAAAPAG